MIPGQMKTKRVAIIGSTGSIGCQTLEVISSQPDLDVCALAAGGNWQLLAEQARQFRPQMVAIADAEAAGKLKPLLAPGTELISGSGAISELVRASKCDVLVTAVVGAAGLEPTLAGIEAGAALAIANKETLVMAGALVMPAARAANVPVLPVDSEHSAVFQCMQAGRPKEVRRVTLTASGGALRDWNEKQLLEATVQDALNHPTWQMGRKITIDSATMMNKALEVVEAHWLFDLPVEQIHVVLHPQSIVHAYVEFCDGSTIAQMAPPDMKVPISYALAFPDRARRSPEPLNLAELGRLTFSELPQHFARAVRLGYEAIRRGGLAGAVLNAANEAAVEAFCDGRIGLGRIVPIVEQVLHETPPTENLSLEALLQADRWARMRVERAIGSRQGSKTAG